MSATATKQRIPGDLDDRVDEMERGLDVSLRTINTIIGMLSDESARQGGRLDALEQAKEKSE